MSSTGSVVILVTGGRTFGVARYGWEITEANELVRAAFERELLWRALDFLHAKRCVLRVIHGAATGADTLAGQWAYARGVEADPHPANWALGHGAGFIRNAQMLALRPHGVVAFKGGAGTAHMVKIARAAAVPVWVPYPHYR